MANTTKGFTKRHYGDEEGASLRVGIFPNMEKQDILERCQQLVGWLHNRGHICVVPSTIDLFTDNSLQLPVEQWPGQVDLVIVLGGDGTLLSAARQLTGSIPILGVNLGRLGFLTELEVPELFTELPKVLSGQFCIDERLMIEATVMRGDKALSTVIALNEIVVTKGSLARIVRVDLQINDKFVDRYHADGIIVATPTGSTAYSLSAGGPVVSPTLDALIVTPICPHTLYSRSMVVCPEDTVSISLPSPGWLTADGQTVVNLRENDSILVKQYRQRVHLVRRLKWSFFDILRRKLKEGNAI